MRKQVAAIGGVLLLVGAAILAFAHWIGFALLGLGAVMAIGGLFLPKDDVPEGHKSTLRETARKIDQSVRNNARLDFGDPTGSPERRKEAFECHFRKSKELLNALNEWDARVHELRMAEAAVLTHLHVRKDELGISLPTYDENLIIPTIRNWIIGGAKQNQSQQIITWNGYGNGWLCPQGLTESWVSVPPVDGETTESWKHRAKEMHQPVDQLFQEAQEWPETNKIGPLAKEIMGLNKPTADAIQPILEREKFGVERRCPICKANKT